MNVQFDRNSFINPNIKRAKRSSSFPQTREHAVTVTVSVVVVVLMRLRCSQNTSRYPKLVMGVCGIPLDVVSTDEV